MAFLGKPRDETTYGRLLGMIQPEATPTKRVGTETPTGATMAGPAAGKTAQEFTQSTKTSPGTIFGRQLAGADIRGITSLAEQPLYREAGEESRRVAQEGIGYKQSTAKQLAEQPQFEFQAKDKEGKPIDQTADIVNRIAGGGEEFSKAGRVLSRKPEDINIPQFTSAPIREYSPMQALRGGTVETLLRQEAKGPYTTGMAGLDALLFKGKGGGQALETAGTGIRTAQQVALDILQGKQGGVLTDAMKGILARVGIDVPAGGLTEEARKKAADFVQSQKEQLEKGLKGGVTAREEAYTKAPEGGVSKLTQAQRDLYNQQQEAFRGAQAEFKANLQKKVQDVEKGLLDQFYRQNFKPTGSAIWEEGGMMTPTQRAQIEADPAYQAMLGKFRESVATPFLQQNELTAIDLDAIPQLQLQNVMSADEATQYNRLRSLLGLPGIEQQTVAKPKASIDYSKSDKFLDELLNRANLNAMMQGTPQPKFEYMPPIFPQGYTMPSIINIGMGG